MVFNATFSYIMSTSISGGRSRSTRREPPTIDRQLVNFITCGSSHHGLHHLFQWYLSSILLYSFVVAKYWLIQVLQPQTVIASVRIRNSFNIIIAWQQINHSHYIVCVKIRNKLHVIRLSIFRYSVASQHQCVYQCILITEDLVPD